MESERSEGKAIEAGKLALSACAALERNEKRKILLLARFFCRKTPLFVLKLHVFNQLALQLVRKLFAI